MFSNSKFDIILVLNDYSCVIRILMLYLCVGLRLVLCIYMQYGKLFSRFFCIIMQKPAKICRIYDIHYSILLFLNLRCFLIGGLFKFFYQETIIFDSESL